MKILGREPTLAIMLISQAVVLLGTFGFGFLDGQQASLIVVAINAIFAAVNAALVRPIAPTAFTYAVGSIVAVAAAYGLNVTAEQFASLSALTIAVLAFVSRGQVSPISTSVTNQSLDPVPEAARREGFRPS